MLRDRLVANDLEAEPAKGRPAFNACHMITASGFENHKLAPWTGFASAAVAHFCDGHFVHFVLLSRTQFVFLALHGQWVGVAVVETVSFTAFLFLALHDRLSWVPDLSVVAVRTLSRQRVLQIGLEPLVFVPCFSADDLVDVLFIEGLAASVISVFVVERVETGHVDHAVLDLAGHEALDAVCAELVTTLSERKAIVYTVFGEADITEKGGRGL